MLEGSEQRSERVLMWRQQQQQQQCMNIIHSFMQNKALNKFKEVKEDRSLNIHGNIQS